MARQNNKKISFIENVPAILPLKSDDDQYSFSSQGIKGKDWVTIFIQRWSDKKTVGMYLRKNELILLSKVLDESIKALKA